MYTEMIYSPDTRARARARGRLRWYGGELPADQSGPPGTPRSQREAAALTDPLARNNAFTGALCPVRFGPRRPSRAAAAATAAAAAASVAPHLADPRSVPRPYRHIAGLQVIG